MKYRSDRPCRDGAAGMFAAPVAEDSAPAEAAGERLAVEVALSLGADGGCQLEGITLATGEAGLVQVWRESALARDRSRQPAARHRPVPRRSR